MARYFTGSTWLSQSPAPFFSSAGTVFLRIRPHWNSGNSIGHVFFIENTSTFSVVFQFQDFTDNMIIAGWTVSGVDTRVHVPDTGIFQNGVWGNHIIDWNDATETVNYYADNVLKGTVSTPAFTVPAINFDSAAIGNYDGGGSVADSDLAEIGRWDRVLSANERAILQVTGTPLSLLRGLVRYVPIIGHTPHEPELIASANMNIVGVTSVASAHPRVIYPQSGFAYSFPPGPAAPLEIQPPLVTNAFTILAPVVTVGAVAGVIAPPLLSSPFQVFAPLVGTDLGLAPPVISNPFTIYAPTVSIQETTIQDDSRELEPHNFRVRITDFVAGDDLRITRLYTDLAGGITITKAYLTIKRTKDDLDADAVVQKTITTAEQMSGKIQDNDTTGGSIQLYFDLTGSDTALMTPLIPFHYDVQIHTIGNAVYTCEIGMIVMHEGVTDAIS